MRWGYIILLYPIHRLYESHNSTEGFTHDRDLYYSYKL